MNLTQYFKDFIRTIVKLWNAFYYIFSACTLIALILVIIHFFLLICGVKNGKIENTIDVVFLTIIGLYVIGKTYYVIASWQKRRKQAKEDALNEELNPSQLTPLPATEKVPQQPTKAQMTANPAMARKPSRLNWLNSLLLSKKEPPPIEPQKAGNTKW